LYHTRIIKNKYNVKGKYKYVRYRTVEFDTSHFSGELPTAASEKLHFLNIKRSHILALNICLIGTGRIQDWKRPRVWWDSAARISILR